MTISAAQAAIVATLQTQPVIDVDAEIRRRIDFIKGYLKFTGLHKLVLGLSGGIDSTTAGKLAQLACDQLNAEHGTNVYEFIAMRLPFKVQADEADAQLAADFIQPSQLLAVNVAAIVEGMDSACSDFVQSQPLTRHKLDFSRGNNKARARMMAQFYIANLTDALVLGTDHSAEAITGFFTKFGDGACDLAPLFGLNKRQVRALASALGAPSQLVTKTPTADLEDDNPQQPDEASLGISYDQIDDFLEGKPIASDMADKLIRRYQITEHKRQGPVTLYCDWYK
ncbi:MAG: ammonia-dependent NAD(+) synthetase [Gammaproteobacteria bacterium]|jgi:NAD+ synthase|nr:ammonia-dependent NAD(+) synthetase [Gammaproteobacteria bacterium]